MDHEEIPYPVAMYRDRLRAEHEHNTEEAFEKLVLESGVDQEANAALVKKIRKREKQIDALNSFAPSSGELMRPALERLHRL